MPKDKKKAKLDTTSLEKLIRNYATELWHLGLTAPIPDYEKTIIMYLRSTVFMPKVGGINGKRIYNKPDLADLLKLKPYINDEVNGYYAHKLLVQSLICFSGDHVPTVLVKIALRPAPKKPKTPNPMEHQKYLIAVSIVFMIEQILIETKTDDLIKPTRNQSYKSAGTRPESICSLVASELFPSLRKDESTLQKKLSKYPREVCINFFKKVMAKQKDEVKRLESILKQVSSGH
ncbi:MAG: hypothetical protein AB7D03_07900 [Thiomicrospira sp.]